MTSTEFGLLRRLEMIGWAKAKFGPTWKNKFAKLTGVNAGRIGPWMIKGRHAGFAMRIELAARAAGFKSRYDPLFKDFEHHNLIVRNFIERAGTHALGHGVHATGEITIQSAGEQLVTALGFDKIVQ